MARCCGAQSCKEVGPGGLERGFGKMMEGRETLPFSPGVDPSQMRPLLAWMPQPRCCDAARTVTANLYAPGVCHRPYYDCLLQ